jgi:hypothetical protein
MERAAETSDTITSTYCHGCERKKALKAQAHSTAPDRHHINHPGTGGVMELGMQIDHALASLAI